CFVRAFDGCRSRAETPGRSDARGTRNALAEKVERRQRNADQLTPIHLEAADRRAVHPFKNLNNGAATSFYEFALADAVITELARIRSLVVRPSSVMSKYQGQVVDPADVGRELSVDAVLSAGFIAVGERFRVNAQLLDVKSGEIIWSDRVDASAEDII